MTSTLRRLGALMVAAAVTVAATGCTTFGPNDIFAAASSGEFHVTAKFRSVLNLPIGAAVQLNGLKVGSVESMSAAGDLIDVRLGFEEDVEVPATVTARVQQDTLLGDTYVALVVPEVPDTGSSLVDGATIPLHRTSSPPQLEDTIAVLANFVNGGSIERLQQTMATLNRTMPSLPDVRRMASVVARDLDDLAGRTDVIDETMTRLIDGSRSFEDVAPKIHEMFSAQGIDYWRLMITAVPAHLAILMPSVGSIFDGGLWAVPMLDSVAATVKALRTVWDKGSVALVQFESLLRTTLVPFAENPQIDISVGGNDAAAGTRELMRLLGGVR